MAHYVNSNFELIFRVFLLPRCLVLLYTDTVLGKQEICENYFVIKFVIHIWGHSSRTAGVCENYFVIKFKSYSYLGNKTGIVRHCFQHLTLE